MSGAKKMKTFSKNDQGEEGQGQLQVPATTLTNTGEGFRANSRGFTVKVLPPQLWEKIFKKIESSRDLLSCWNATSAWRSSLQSPELCFKMTLPFVLPYLKRKDLLECSSVCKSWNATVVACMQIAEEFGSASRLTPAQTITLVYCLKKMPEFVNRFNLSRNSESGEKMVGINPVAFQRVFVNLETDVEDNPSQQNLEGNHNTFSVGGRNLLQCLDHHGHFIRHLHLLFPTKTVSCFDIVELLKSCLKRTPNLCVLIIDSYTMDDLNYDDYVPGLDSFLVFESDIINPWPALEHLKVLKFDININQPELASITKAYASQLLSIEFAQSALLEPFEPGKFPRLQKIVYPYTKSWDGLEFGKFLQGSNSPLKYLSLEISPLHNRSSIMNYVDGVMLMTGINAVGATLETLVLHLDWELGYMFGFNEKLSKFEGLRLPVLKILDLMGYGYPSLEYLLSVCPALQQLTVHPAMTRECCPKMIKAGKMWFDLYSQHQFWNQLRDIQRVEVKCMYGPTYAVDENGNKIEKTPGGHVRKVYTRAGYKAKLEQNRETSSIRSTSKGTVKGHEDKEKGAPNVLVTRNKKVHKRT